MVKDMDIPTLSQFLGSLRSKLSTEKKAKPAPKPPERKMEHVSLDQPKCRVPKRGTQCYTLLQAMLGGQRITMAKAFSEYGIGACSQRMTELRYEYGWGERIHVRLVEVKPGTRVAEYSMENSND